MSGTEIFGNIFYKVHWAMFIGGAGIIASRTTSLSIAIRQCAQMGAGCDNSPVWRGMVNDYMRKELVAVPLNLYRERYPAMKSFDAYTARPKDRRSPATISKAFRPRAT